MVWEGLLESTKRGVWTLSKKGENYKLTEKESHDLFLKWVDIHAKNRKVNKDTIEIPSDPDEEDEDINNLNPNYREQLISLLRNLNWKSFEKFSLMLLRESGFEELKLTNPGKDEGIYITTSYFTSDAIKEASRDGAQPIELVDAEKLIDLIEEKEFGLKPIKSYELDYDFFKQFE